MYVIITKAIKPMNNRTFKLSIRNEAVVININKMIMIYSALTTSDVQKVCMCLFV